MEKALLGLSCIAFSIIRYVVCIEIAFEVADFVTRTFEGAVVGGRTVQTCDRYTTFEERGGVQSGKTRHEND
jgi:hypothetical protein